MEERSTAEDIVSPLLRPIRRTAVFAAAAAALLAPAAASAACAEQPSTQAFKRFGDTAQYSPAPDGGFENRAAGWSLTNTQSVVANDVFKIMPGLRSIKLEGNAIALSPEFCVDETHPTFRFMHLPLGLNAKLRAVVIYRDSAGKLAASQFEALNTSVTTPLWQPSDVSPLAASIPLTKNGGSALVRLAFYSLGGTHWIDNVMVDPYRRG